MSKTAGIVIIGNEVLPWKTQDINSHFFCAELRQLGVDVQKIATIPDEIELIGREVAAFSKAFDFVFTSGGVGPTHDDVTMEGIAKAFDVPLVRDPALLASLTRYYAKELTQAQLKMTEVPRGAQVRVPEADRVGGRCQCSEHLLGAASGHRTHLDTLVTGPSLDDVTGVDVDGETVRVDRTGHHGLAQTGVRVDHRTTASTRHRIGGEQPDGTRRGAAGELAPGRQPQPGAQYRSLGQLTLKEKSTALNCRSYPSGGQRSDLGGRGAGSSWATRRTWCRETCGSEMTMSFASSRPMEISA